MRLVRTLLFDILLVLWSFVLGLTLIAAPIMTENVVWWISETWLKVIRFLLRWVVGITYEVRGQEYIPEGAAVFASKHQSTWETFTLALIVKRPAFIMKKELLRIPFFGSYVQMAGSIAIDRSKGVEALKTMLQAALHVTNAGRPIIIFPEGTRTKVGQRLKYRRRGVTAMYAKLAVPVVPVALNSGLFWSKYFFIKNPGKVLIEFLPPIPPGLDDLAFIDTLSDRIEEASDRLAEESRALLLQ